MKIKEIIQYLESLVPLSLQESYDNSGLIIGDKEQTITNVLVTLDCTEAVIDEAISKNCNLIIAHHPIIFSGLKKINGNNYIEKVVVKSIKNDISIYACHTNLDNYKGGVNAIIAEKIGLQNVEILAPKEEKKLLTIHFENEYLGHYHQIRAQYKHCILDKSIKSITSVSAASIKNQSKAVVTTSEEFSNIHLSSIYQMIDQMKVQFNVEYNIVSVGGQSNYGAGMIGELSEKKSTLTFLKELKGIMNTALIKHTNIHTKTVKRIAVCGGSGRFLLNTAIQSKADIFISSDFKYHEYFDANNQIIIADIGHFESEQFTLELLNSIITQKFNNFAVHKAKTNTNPVNYL